MSLVTVFRIINDHGRGFYHDGFNKNFPAVENWYNETQVMFPSEITDFLAQKHAHLNYDDSVSKSLVFGFLSAQSMVDWFPEAILKDVKKFGGKIMMYKLDESYVTEYPTQCIFDLSKVQYVLEIDYMQVMELVEPLLDF